MSKHFLKFCFDLARRAPLFGPKGPTVAAEGCSPPQELGKCRGTFSSIYKVSNNMNFRLLLPILEWQGATVGESTNLRYVSPYVKPVREFKARSEKEKKSHQDLALD